MKKKTNRIEIPYGTVEREAREGSRHRKGRADIDEYEEYQKGASTYGAILIQT